MKPGILSTETGSEQYITTAMKKALKKIALFFATAVALVVVVLILFIVRSAIIRGNMTPVETSQLTDDVYVIKEKYVNMYLVRDGDDFIAIDAAISRGTVKSEMKKLGIDPDRVRAVFLTHSDADHAGGLRLFDKAEIYLPKDEEQLIDGRADRFLWVGNKIDVSDYKLVDDSPVKIGSLKVVPVAAPGHTPGTTCYQVNERYLFTGDVLRLYNGTLKSFPGFSNSNKRQARKSVNSVTGLKGVQYIFTGHYGYTDNYERAVKGR